MERVVNKLGWVVAAVVSLIALAAVAGIVHGGPLDRPGSPASTSGVLRPGTPITALPYTISSAGNYYLTGNLTMTASGNGITIMSDDVTLDLGGFTIDGGSVGTDGVSVASVGQNSQQSITVKNGNAVNWLGAGFQFQYGVTNAAGLQSSHNKDGIVIDGGTLRDCTSDFDSEYGVEAGFTTVANCNAEEDGTGFQLFQSTLSHCVADGNTSAGINVSRGTVEDCTLDQNFYGILVADESTVHDNMVIDSKSDGIRVVTGVGSLISGNTSNYNGDSQSASGIYVETDQNRITGNTVSGTIGFGIDVVGNFNTIDGNSAFANSDVGINVAGSKNTVVKNSATGNKGLLSSTNYAITASGTYGANNPGTIGAANSQTLPWSNTQ